MDVTQARQDLELKLAQRGIIGDAVDAEITKIVESIPKLVRESYDADPTIAAAQYAEKYYAGQDGAVPSAQPVQAPTAGGVAEVSIPAADMRAIQAFQNSTRPARSERAQKTKITQLIGDKPYPGTYLSKDLKMIPRADEAKFASYRELLVDTPENIANYEQCMKAIKEKTPMDIYIPEESKWNPKMIGAIVDTPADNGSGNESRPMDNKAFLAFVAYDLNGFILCDANGTGAKLGTVRTKKSSKASAAQSVLTPRLIIVNKKEAFNDKNRHVFASRPKKNGEEVLTKEGTVRSALSFQIYTGKTNKMGEKKTRTVRVSGRANVPRWERVNAAFEDIFGTSEKQSNVVAAPNSKERAAMDAIINKTLYAIQNNAAEYGEISYQIEQDLAKAAGETAQSRGADFS